MKKYVKLAGNILAVLSIFFVIYTIAQMDIDISIIGNSKGIFVLGIIGIAVSGLTTVLLGYAWTRVINYYAKESVGYKTGISIYTKANLGKYLPGNVMHYVERNVFAARHNLNQIEIVMSTVLEVVGLIIAAVVVSLVLSIENLKIAFSNLISAKYLIIIGIVILLCIFAAIVLYLKCATIKTLVNKMLNLKFLLMYLGNIAIYIIVFIILGLILVSFVNAMNGRCTLQEDLMICSVYTLAWVLGFVVPGAPGGIGVREFVISLLTRGSGLGNIILMAAVIHRLATVMGDVCAYFFTRERK